MSLDYDMHVTEEPEGVRFRGEEFDFSTANDVNPTVKEIEFDYAVAIKGMWTNAWWSQYNANDKIDIYFVKGSIGTVDQESTSGQDKAYLTDAALAKILEGDKLKLGSEDHLYQVKSKAADHVVLTANLNVTKNVDDDAKHYLPRMEGQRLMQGFQQCVMKCGGGPHRLPAGQKIEIHYHHNTDPDSAWTFSFGVGYYHGIT